MDVQTRLEAKNLSYAKHGIVWALIGGLLYGITPFFQTLASAEEPLKSGVVLGIFAVPFVMGFLQDGIGGLWVLIPNLKNGKGKEYARALKTKPGKIIVLGSVCGGLMATASFMVGINLAGPVYPVAISATFPAVGALMSRLFLKEKISKRGLVGILLCVAGAITIGWTAPTGEAYPHFYLGMVFGALAALGWSLEGIISCSGMDFIDPEVALGIRQFVSAAVFLVCLPFVAGFGFSAFKLLVATIPTIGFVFMICAGFGAGVAYYYYYKANNACGAARGMALNITYTVSSAVLAVLFLGSQITTFFVVGIVVLLMGGLLASGDPREMFTLRDVVQEEVVPL